MWIEFQTSMLPTHILPFPLLMRLVPLSFYVRSSQTQPGRLLGPLPVGTLRRSTLLLCLQAALKALHLFLSLVSVPVSSPCLPPAPFLISALVGHTATVPARARCLHSDADTRLLSPMKAIENKLVPGLNPKKDDMKDFIAAQRRLYA